MSLQAGLGHVQRLEHEHAWQHVVENSAAVRGRRELPCRFARPQGPRGRVGTEEELAEDALVGHVLGAVQRTDQLQLEVDDHGVGWQEVAEGLDH